MPPRLQFVAFVVLFQLFPSGLGGRGRYFNYIQDGKVTAEEMEAEMAAMTFVVPASIFPIPPTPEFIVPGQSPMPGPPAQPIAMDEGDADVAFFPSPDDDGTFLRVIMSDVSAMEFHYTENMRPVTLLMSFPGFTFWPKRVKTEDVQFYLFTKKTANGIRLYNNKDNGPAVEEFWIKGGQVKILCHGYRSSYLKPFPQHMKDSYMKLDEDLNVILVDWSKLASSFFYFTVAKQTTGVGQQVSTLVQSLIKEGLTTLDQVHFIGHSLGAHVGGAFGFTLTSNKVGNVSRITGLDPAGPGFCDGDIGQLQMSDGHFVDVIHTDDSAYCQGKIAWILNRAKGKWGSDATSGHSNFFPNGGRMQPGCGTGITDSCSHSRAYYYMEESFNGTTGHTVFKGCPCDSYDGYLAGDCICSSDNFVVMGEYTPVVRDGSKYFLKTGPKYPYSHVI